MGTTVIGVMNTLFWICLSFAVLFFIVSVVLFFIFDIKTIFNIKTGRARAKTVKEMKAANESTGRLRVAGKTQTSKLSEKEKSVSRAPAVIPPNNEEKSQYYTNSNNETEALGTDGTEVLYAPPAPEQFPAETSVLSENSIYHTENFAADNSGNRIGFSVIKKIIYTHTNEMI